MKTSTMSNYGDRIFSDSELNRRAGHILDIALTESVTITRNNDSFALLKKESVTNIAKELEQTNQVNQLINVVYRLTLGQKIESSNEFKWIEEFTNEERIELVNEVYEALNLAKSTDDWEEIAAVIHEWKESAIALSSDELVKAFDRK